MNRYKAGNVHRDKKTRNQRSSNQLSLHDRVNLLWHYLQLIGGEGPQYTKDEIRSWFESSSLGNFRINGRVACDIWGECYRIHEYGNQGPAAAPAPAVHDTFNIFGTAGNHGLGRGSRNSHGPGNGNPRNGNPGYQFQDPELEVSHVEARLLAAASFVNEPYGNSAPRGQMYDAGDFQYAGNPSPIANFNPNVPPPPLTFGHVKLLARTPVQRLEEPTVAPSPAEPVRRGSWSQDARNLPPQSVETSAPSAAPKFPKFSRTRIADEGKIGWIDPDTEEIGTFFINKLCVGDEPDRYWEPTTPSTASVIQKLSFAELVPTEQLLRAVITPACNLETTVRDRFLEHFPQSVKLEVLLQEADAAKTSTDFVLACNSCSQLLVAADETSSVRCPDCRFARILRFTGNELWAKFIFLRYTDRVKLIILSSALNSVHWNKLIQFGWFCCFPIIPSGDELLPDRAVSAFGSDLQTFLNSLRLPAEELLDRVDFTNLSPAVNLIFTIPGAFFGEARSPFGVSRLHRLMDGIPWFNDPAKKSLYQTVRIGSSKIGHNVNSLFRLPISVGRNRAAADIFQAGFPSANRMLTCIGAVGAREAALVATAFENKDKNTPWPPRGGMVGKDGMVGKEPLDIRFNYLCGFQHNLVDKTFPHLLHHYNLACQYQFCTAGTSEQQRLYGWLVVGSQSIGTSSWGDTESKTSKVTYFLRHVGVAFCPYLLASESSPDNPTVRALDLCRILPFALDQFVPYTDPPYVQHVWEKSERARFDHAGNTRGWNSRGAEPPPVERLSIARVPSRVPVNNSDADNERLERSRVGGVELINKQFLTVSRSELDAMTMNPLRIPTDLHWLESHVRTVCGNQLPALVGPYTVPFLLASLEGHRKNFICGMELLESSVSGGSGNT